MTTQANKILVTNFFNTVSNEHDLGATDWFLSEQYVRHSAGTTGREPFMAFFGQLFGGLSNYHVTIRQPIAEDDRVVVYNTIEGTHTGPLLSHAPTNRLIRYDAVDVYRVENERLTEHWSIVDTASLLRQISALAAN